MSVCFLGTGRDDNGAVDSCHSWPAQSDRFFYRVFEVIEDKQFRHTAKEGQAAVVGVQLGHHILAFAGLNVGLVRCAHHGHDDGHPEYFPGIRIDDGDRRAAEVDKEFFASAVLTAHGQVSLIFLVR